MSRLPRAQGGATAGGRKNDKDDFHQKRNELINDIKILLDRGALFAERLKELLAELESKQLKKNRIAPIKTEILEIKKKIEEAENGEPVVEQPTN